MDIQEGKTTKYKKYQNLLFPLNVYAALLERNFGMVESLHFGCFDYPGQSLPEAQQNASNLLATCLDAPDLGKTVEVGAGFGVMLQRLLAAGYDVLGINPDTAQVAVARARYGLTDTHLRACSFEELNFAENSLHCLLFQESAQYINSLLLLQKSADLLETSGLLLVMDEFQIICDRRQKRRLHYLPHFIRQAERVGFIVEKQSDLGSRVLPTLEYIINELADHGREIARALSLKTERLALLTQELHLYLDNYRAGIFSYCLLALRKKRKSPYRTSPGNPAAVPEICRLFTSVFEQSCSPDDYRRKYRNGRAMLVRHAGRLVGHYGGMGRRILFKGRPEQAVQIGDVMVAPSHRRPKGPFLLMASAFVEQYVGFCGEYLLAFGFPHCRAMRIGHLLDLYWEVDTMVQLTMPPQPLRRSMMFSRRKIRPEEYPMISGEIDTLWQQMARDFSENIIGVRDGAYLQSRYLARSDRHYEVMAVRNRWNRRLRAILVFCEHGEDGLLLIDYIAPLAEFSRMARLAQSEAARWGGRRLCVWLTASFAARLQPPTATLDDLDISVPMSSCVPGPSLDEVRGRWWLTAGDTDFL